VPAPAAGTLAEPHRHHDLTSVLVEIDVLDHHARFDAEHPRPYPLGLHPVDPFAHQPSDSRKAKPDNGVHPRMVSYSPTEGDGEPQKAGVGDQIRVIE
jgi:hypothetical protein